MNFSVVETRFIQDATLPVPFDLSGNPLINAANLNASGIVSWPLVTNDYGTITPQYDFTWSDDQPFDPNNGRGAKGTDLENKFPSYTVGQRAYVLHNLRLSWTPPGSSGMTLAGWCRNVLDQRYKSFAVDLSAFSNQQLWFIGDPRTCGADLRMTW